MQKIRDHGRRLARPTRPARAEPAAAAERPVAMPAAPVTPALPDDAARLRSALAGFAQAAAGGTLVLHRPQRGGDALARGDGHFHLTPELFLQVGGWTRFRFPHGQQLLRAGQALVVPAQLRHAERVGGSAGEPFCNLVLRADGPLVTLHLARERRAAGGAGLGQPGIAHLASRSHPQAQRLQDWLADVSAPDAAPPDADAAATGAGEAGDGGWAAVQARALLAAVLAGALRLLDEAPDATAASVPREPPWLAPLAVLIQNQLGDPALGVRRLAEQVGTSADHLSQQFRRLRGEPLLDHILRLRMARAEHLLRDTPLAVKEVAWACGFASASYFIRQFRLRHGCTPVQWQMLASA